MNEPDDHGDRQFDDLLREFGPDIPQPELDDPARARLMALIDGPDARPAGRIGRSARWLKPVAAAGIAAAAVLGVSCIVLWTSLGRVRDQLAMSHRQTEEVFQLLASARRTQPSIPPPQDLEGLSSSDLVLITFHHDLCPIARLCSPGFRNMAKSHSGEAARFITFDVTGANLEQADRQIDELGMRFALLGPLGAETGVVKVLDTRHQRVLCSAPGKQGLEQAELVLARVPHGS